MGDLKLIGKSYNQIYTLVQKQYMICGYQDILGQETHRRKIAKIHKDFWIIQSFHNFMPKNIVIPRNHTILMRTKSILILPLTFTTFQLYTNFHQKKLVLFIFSHLLTSTNPTILLDALPIKETILFIRIFVDKIYQYFSRHWYHTIFKRNIIWQFTIGINQNILVLSNF